MKRKSLTKGSRKVWSQKRVVIPLKVFVTPEEKDVVLQNIGDFRTVSNYIRHHIGLVPNLIGPKKKAPVAAFEIEDLGLKPTVKKQLNISPSGMERMQKGNKAKPGKKTGGPTKVTGSKTIKPRRKPDPGYFQGNLFEDL